MAIEIKDLQKFNKTVCAIPWMHIALEPDGKAIPCCLTSVHNYFVGDLTKQPIEEIWNSDNMKSLRKDMINGIEPTICNKCFDREKITGESGRFYHNKQHPKVVEKIPMITEPDGTCNTMELKYWDFRFSNLCNFKCRSCGPRYSSTWVPDATKLGWIPEQDKVWNVNVQGVSNLSNYEFLKEQIQHVEEIYFAGGEPLMMPEHWQTLDMLVQNKKLNVKLSYNTNASILTYGGKNVLDYWRQWNPGQIEVWPSIDEIGDRAELIRSGTVWKKVEENLKAISALDNIVVRPGLTIGAWNVFRLPEIITYLKDIGVLKFKKEFGANYDNFFVNLLVDPHHYHVRILPDNFKKETIVKLNEFIFDYNKKYNTDIGINLTHILHELTTPFDRKSARRFIEVTGQVDQIRNENLFEVIPEMECVKKAVNE